MNSSDFRWKACKLWCAFAEKNKKLYVFAPLSWQSQRGQKLAARLLWRSEHHCRTLAFQNPRWRLTEPMAEVISSALGLDFDAG